MPRHTSTDSSLKSLNKSRNATPLTSAMEKKLSGYAILAKVVYTPTHQKLR